MFRHGAIFYGKNKLEGNMHNIFLAHQRGIPQDERDEIDLIHSRLENMLDNTTFDQTVYDAIEQLEYDLQGLWGFEKDSDKHTWKHLYEFRCKWVGAKYQCKTTGLIFTIPDTVKPRDFFSWGKAFVDVGRPNCYARFSNCVKLGE